MEADARLICHIANRATVALPPDDTTASDADDAIVNLLLSAADVDRETWGSDEAIDCLRLLRALGLLSVGYDDDDPYRPTALLINLLTLRRDEILMGLKLDQNRRPEDWIADFRLEPTLR
jgi:hypothetical protein